MTIIEPRQNASTSTRPERSPVARAVAIVLAKRFAGFWVLAAVVVLFAILTPDTFLTQLTFTTTLNDGAITGLIALGLILPLLAGILDLSVAWIAGFAMVTVTHLNAIDGMGDVQAAVIALIGCAGFGLVSAILITKLHVNSLVATLGVGTVALGITQRITGGNSITGAFGDGFSTVGQGKLLGVPYPFIFVLAFAAVIYYILDHTILGRQLQAVGGNPIAARLSGIKVERFQGGVVVVSALMSGFAGIVLAAQVGVATDSSAPAFLLPAAAAVFLGATQIREQANPWGTVLAVLLLCTGIKGLQLLGAASWTNAFFNGVVLLIAVSFAANKGGGQERLV